MIQSLLILLQIIRRDFFVFSRRLANYGINYLILFPLLAIVTFGYIQPGVYFGPGHGKASIALLVGIFTLNILSLCFNLLVPFVYDVEEDRFIDYQISLLPPRLLLLEMIVFPAILANVISLPFFPLARVLLPSYFADINPSWPALLLVIFCICLCCSAYIMLAFCLITKSDHVRQFWLRLNWPLMVLGGFWIPWYLLRTYSPLIAYLSLLNPFTYMTEGIRSALIGSDQFIPYWICIIALITFFSLFILGASYFFKQKLDHI